MSKWQKVRWTQARQITQLMGAKESESPSPEVQPADFYASLREQGDLAEAVRFLGHALPRYEAVVWAAQAIKAMPGLSLDTGLMKAVKSWIDDPEDGKRRNVWSAAEMADEDNPERLLGYSVFLSGGSIAPQDQAPVNPAPQLCGQLASAAIIAAAHASGDPEATLGAALSAGEAIAGGGS
jgi:hypothetical protein